jgi:hypothetical protein
MVSSVVSKITGYFTSLSGPNNEIIEEAKELEKLYNKRNEAFKVWYKLLRLDDDLAQKNMESFVGNDPRTTFNMAVHLLRPKPFTHHLVSTDGVVLNEETKEFAHAVQQYFSRVWSELDTKESRRGRHSWFGGLIGLLAATGWLAIPYAMHKDGTPFVDYWNPASVYPEHDDEGLIRVARIRRISKHQVLRRISSEGWIMPQGTLPSRPVETQLYKKIDNTVWHGVCVENHIVKPMSIVVGTSDIPIIVIATGGLPDDGVIDPDYMASYGQSILATNAPVFKNYNRQQTFMQQLLRDTANPRWKVKSTSDKDIVTSEEMEKRGVIIKMGPNDDISPVDQLSIPAELTQILFGLRNQIQRGGFSDLTFGNVVQEVTSVLMAQSAEAAMQLLEPYYLPLTYSISEVTNSWYRMFVNNPSIRPKSWPDIDRASIENTRITSTYNIKIPGDLQNRINIIKALNPRLEIPMKELIELFLPEITNIEETLAKLDAEKAKQHPMYQGVILVRAFEKMAESSRRGNNAPAAELFDTVSGMLRSQLTQQPSSQDKMAGAGELDEAAGVIPQDVRMG